MKRNKMFVAVFIIFAMIVCCIPARAEETKLISSGDLNQLVQNGEVFAATAVKNDLMAYARSNEASGMLQDVLKAGSMGITIPKIDAAKIVRTSSPKISELAGCEEFYAELEKHGIPREKTADITLDEYNAIESTWLLDDSFIDTILCTHADLTAEELSEWTIGEYQAYMKADNLERLKERFTAEQLAELNERGIQIEDTMYLLKEFHQPEFILEQADATIKETLEGYYTFNLEQTLGEGTVAQWEVLYGEEVELLSSPTYVLPEGAVGKYTWVDFPLYGGDYFINEVLTTAYWREIQAYRTLLTQCTLYGQSYDRTKAMHCSNLYGTFSRSQGGAHEGIDFADGAIRPIFSPVDGISIQVYFNNEPESERHRLAIYDAYHADYGKTYNFLHMNYRESASAFEPGDLLGHQGTKGNSTGYHVHFEVQAGRTTDLAAENNHTLGSISPYRLTEYIGEG